MWSINLVSIGVDTGNIDSRVEGKVTVSFYSTIYAGNESKVQRLIFTFIIPGHQVSAVQQHHRRVGR